MGGIQRIGLEPLVQGIEVSDRDRRPQSLRSGNHGAARVYLLQRGAAGLRAGNSKRGRSHSGEKTQAMMSKPRALVTGGAGFLGSHLCDALLGEGYSVVAVDNLLTGRQSNLEHLRNESRFEFRQFDINETFDCGRVDYVFHFASPASPVDYTIHGIETLKAGSLGTFHALDVALKYHAKYLLSSTSECYGDPLEHPQKETYWGHVNPIGPRSVYDEAKRFSEAVTMAYHRYYRVDTRITRIFNTYGPRMQLNDGRVVPNFMKQALRGEELTVYGDGSQTRNICRSTSGTPASSPSCSARRRCLRLLDRRARSSTKRCRRMIPSSGVQTLQRQELCWDGSRKSIWTRACESRWSISAKRY